MPQFHYYLQGHAYHTISVTDGRKPLFTTPALAEIVVRSIDHIGIHRAQVLAFAVMPDHLHLVAVPRDGETIATIMQSLKGFTARELNLALGRKGRVWQQSYYDRVIRDEDQLLAAVRYIEWNPVEDGLVSTPAAYPHSSASRQLDGQYEAWLSDARRGWKASAT